MPGSGQSMEKVYEGKAIPLNLLGIQSLRTEECGTTWKARERVSMLSQASHLVRLHSGRVSFLSCLGIRFSFSFVSIADLRGSRLWSSASQLRGSGGRLYPDAAFPF